MGVTCYFSFKKFVLWSGFLDFKKKSKLYKEVAMKNEVLWEYEFKDYSYYILRSDSSKKYKFEEFSCWADLFRKIP